MLRIRCHSCDQSFSTDHLQPRFCSHCGAVLDESSFIDGNVVGDSSLPKSTDELDAPTLVHSTREKQASLADATSQYSLRASKVVSNSTPAPDNTVGNYKIIRKLGQGGMGEVYQAENIHTHQQVALKLLSRNFLATDEAVERFQRESQIAASINHPHSTFVYEAGRIDGQYYISMELMPGLTLKDVVEQEGKLSVGRAVDYLLDVIDGLQPAHAADIVHRDLKPSNCFLDHSGRVKVGDYGLSKSFETATDLTQAGTFMGTPQFAAPEQLRSTDVNQSSDIYALGAILFYLLAGRAPFIGNTAQVISSIASETPPDVRKFNDQVPNTLARLVERILDKNPEKRPENLKELQVLLLPFSTRGVSQADIGRRIAAFCIDIILVSLVVATLAPFIELLAVLFAAALGVSFFNGVVSLPVFIQFAGLVLYFTLQEWGLGTTYGKWQMGMRVINQKNESPSFLQALIRATFIPGISFLVSVIPLFGINPAGASEESEILFMMRLQLFFLLAVVVNLLILSTSRLSNGYRGIHGLLSGTRVVRLGGVLENERPKSIPVTVPISCDLNCGYDPVDFEGFELLGILPAKSKFRRDVLVAKDTGLDRTVWLVREETPTGYSNFTKELSKFEARVLGRFQNRQGGWLICESLQGMPLVDFLENSPRLAWYSLLPLMQDIVLHYQLVARSHEGAGPILLEQIWLTEGGQIKFLNWDGISDQISLSVSGEGDRLTEQAIQVFSSLLEIIIRNHDVPAHVFELHGQLPTLKKNIEGLTIVREALSDMEDRPSSWNWRDRLGVQAVSFGFEFVILFSLMILGSLSACCFLDWSIGFTGLAIFLVGIGLSLMTGFFLRGGLAFRLSGVSVLRSSDFAPAAQWQCAIRNGLSWLFPLIWLTCLVVVIDLFIAERTLAGENLDNIIAVIAIALLLLVPLLVGGGIVYAILRPSRGLIDVICLTRLVRE